MDAEHQDAQEIAQDVAAKLGLGYGGVIKQLVREFPDRRAWENARNKLVIYQPRQTIPRDEMQKGSTCLSQRSKP